MYSRQDLLEGIQVLLDKNAHYSPVLHVKQWPLRPRMTRYVEPMRQAAQEIRQALAETAH
jgi:hypothetical protein